MRRIHRLLLIPVLGLTLVAAACRGGETTASAAAPVAEPRIDVAAVSARVADVESALGGTVAAKRSAASARVRQEEHGQNATLDSARLELASASTELDASREIVATQRKAVELAREGLSIAEVSYERP